MPDAIPTTPIIPTTPSAADLARRASELLARYDGARFNLVRHAGEVLLPAEATQLRREGRRGLR